jgi:hypothetical protein
VRAWVASLGFLCACNQVFGVDHTTRLPGPPGGPDAQYFDAPADAPFACPALGGVPQFKRDLRQVDIDGCRGYTRSDTLAVAMCGQVSQGPVDGPLAPIPDVAATTLSPSSPLLSPDGDQLYLSDYDFSTYTSLPFHVYNRQGDGSWQRGADLPMSPVGTSISTVTRGPDRHILYWAYGLAGANIEEWANGTGSWQQVAVHGQAEHGLAAIFYVWFSSDGLRAIIQGDVLGSSAPQLFYTDRAAVGASFRPAVPMIGVPVVNDMFVTEDCGRLYMSGLGSIFYQQQE